MKKNCFLILLVVSLISACNPFRSEKNITSQIQLITNTDTISIPIDTLCLSYYFVYTNFSENNRNYFIGYNALTHALDFFDLDKYGFLRHLNLDSQGPNKVDRIEGLYYHNSDSIFVYTRGFLSIIDSTGIVNNRISLSEKSTSKEYSELICNYYFSLQYVPQKETVYLFNLYPTAQKSKFKNYPVISALNMKDETINSLPIVFSNYYIEKNGQLGYLSWVNFYRINNNKLIFNYQYESNIYEYNIFTEEIKIHGAKSINYQNIASTLKNPNISEAWSKHALENTHFLMVLVDPWRNLYYRFIWGGVEQRSETEIGRYNSFVDKPLSITILDTDFKVIKEFDLPGNLFSVNVWFVNENGLYLSPSHPKGSLVDEDFLKFIIYQFEKNNH